MVYKAVIEASVIRTLAFHEAALKSAAMALKDAFIGALYHQVSKKGKSITVGKSVDFLARPAHGALLEGMRCISGNVSGGEKGVDRNFFHKGEGAEHAGDSLHPAAVVKNAFDGTTGGFSGIDRRNQDQHILARNHGREVVAEDELAVRIVFGGDHIDVFVPVD